MINLERVSKAKADVIAVHAQIEGLVNAGKEEFLSDPRSPLALKYLLIEGVEAIADLCQHVLAKTKGIACEGYVDCILKAGREGIVTAELAGKLRRLADLRNHLVHRYWIIDDEQLFRITYENRGDLIDFSDQVDAFLESLSSDS